MIAVIYIFSHGAQIRLGWAYRHFFCLISGRTVVRAKVYVKKGPITCLSNSSLGVFSIHFVKEARAFTLLDGLATAGDVRVLDRKPQWASPAARDWDMVVPPFHRTVSVLSRFYCATKMRSSRTRVKFRPEFFI